MERKNVPVDPKVHEQKTPKGEVTYLLGRVAHLEDRLFKAEKDTSLKRVGVTSLCTFGVYCSWACEWVNEKFLIVVSAIAIAVIAATLGSLWEKTRSKGGEIK